MNAIEEFHYFLVMPEPENGYNAALAHIDEYAKLFSLLADRCKLRLLSYICSCKESLLSVQSTAKTLGFDEDETLELLEQFCTLEWVLPESIDMGNGPVRVYRPGETMALLPLLCFAREFMANAKLFYLNNYLRTKPMLQGMLEE